MQSCTIYRIPYTIYHISTQHYYYNLAWLLEAFIGVAVNKEDRLEDGGYEKGG